MFVITTRIPSTLNGAREEITEVLNILEGILNEDDYFNTRLILNELVINGVCHGNKFEENKYVELCLYFHENFIEIQVKDQGIGIDFSPCSYEANRDNILYKDCGRGLHIVEHLTRDLNIQNNEVYCIYDFQTGRKASFLN